MQIREAWLDNPNENGDTDGRRKSKHIKHIQNGNKEKCHFQSKTVSFILLDQDLRQGNRSCSPYVCDAILIFKSNLSKQ